MAGLNTFIRIEAISILGLLCVAVVSMILDGRIRVTGLMSSKCTGSFDPARLQLLVVTLTVALLIVARFGHMRAINRVELPSTVLLYLLGGGHGTYLFEKVRQTRQWTKNNGPAGNA